MVSMRRSSAILFAFAVVFFATGAPPAIGAEFITVPAEGSSKVSKENFATARTRAIAMAFQSALRLATKGLTPRNSYSSHRNLIERNIVAKGSAFVSSYKLLNEVIDPAGSRLTVNLQVTLFLDSVRTQLRRLGVQVKRPPLPNLLILIDEKNANIISNPNFLLFNSLSEDLISRAYRQRGYAVSNRMNIRRVNIGAVALQAFSKDQLAMSAIRRTFETDLFIFGATEVDVEKIDNRNNVTATVSASLIGTDGSTLATYESRAKGVYIDPLQGSLELIRTACAQIIRDMSVETPRIWRESKGHFYE